MSLTEFMIMNIAYFRLNQDQQQDIETVSVDWLRSVKKPIHLLSDVDIVSTHSTNWVTSIYPPLKCISL